MTLGGVTGFFCLFGVFDGLGLPEQVDLDLAGVLQLALDLLGVHASQTQGLQPVQQLRGGGLLATVGRSRT